MLGRHGCVVRRFGRRSDFISSVAFQEDGKIIAVGGNGRHGRARLMAARYDADGRRDRTFGVNGKVVTRIVDEKYLYFGGVAIQEDGRIIVVGSTWAVRKNEGGRFWLVRYKANGSLDSGFGANGMVKTDFQTAFPGASANAVAVQQDGKIVVAGSLVPPGDSGRLAFVRYTADGHLDATFGTNGITTTNLNSFGSGELQGLAIQPDGKLIGAGFHSTSMVLVRYGTNGQRVCDINVRGL
jgi:uncharacterized delta-60 repeat protein